MEENYVEPYFIIQKRILNYLRYLNDIGKLGFIRNQNTDKEEYINVQLKIVGWIYICLLNLDNDTAGIRKIKDEEYFYFKKNNFCEKNGFSINTLNDAIFTLEQLGILEIFRRKRYIVDKKTGNKKFHYLPNYYKFYDISQINFKYEYNNSAKNKVGFVRNAKITKKITFIEGSRKKDSAIEVIRENDRGVITERSVINKININKIKDKENEKKLNSIFANAKSIMLSNDNIYKNGMINHSFKREEEKNITSKTRCKENVEKSEESKEIGFLKGYENYKKNKYSKKGVKLKPLDKFNVFLHENFDEDEKIEIKSILNIYSRSFGEKNAKNYKSRLRFLEDSIEMFGSKKTVELMKGVYKHYEKFGNAYNPYSFFTCEVGFPLLAYMISFNDSLERQEKYEKKDFKKTEKETKKKGYLMPTLEKHKEGETWQSFNFICPECEKKMKGQNLGSMKKCSCGYEFDLNLTLEKFIDKYKKFY